MRRGIVAHPEYVTDENVGQLAGFDFVFNWSFACQSHYFIRKGIVVWAGQLSRRQIEGGRALDRKAREQYTKEVNRERALPPHNFLYKAWMALKRWWTS
jgi:hypothetical protein